MSPPRVRLLAVAIACLVALPVVSSSRRAAASIVVAMDLPALVKQADHIAVVDVVSTSADWDDKHQQIFSTVELKVVERWKGTATTGGQDHLRVVQPGGTVGDLTMTVTGLSTFTTGERALVFLRGAATNARVLGLGQGKRPMRQETTSGRWLVQGANLRQATLVKPRSATPAPGLTVPASGQTAGKATGIVAAAPGADSARERALDELRSEVKSLLGASAQ